MTDPHAPESAHSGASVTSRALAILASFENSTGSLSVAKIAQRALSLIHI
jgi:hypothetical protein